MAHLFVLKGLNVKQTIALEKDRTLIGRNATCDIVLPANDFAVSREHACILRIQNKFFIEDMGSRNGTFVNNQQLTERHQLRDNDHIRICDFLYSFHEAAPAPKPPLPPEVLPEPTIDEPEEESSNFEASVGNSSALFLESQPAEKLKALVDISNNLSKTLELKSLLPTIVDNLFQLFKQADRCFIIMREEGIERDKPFDRLIPTVIKTRRAQDETSAYSRSIVRECLKTVQALLSDDAATDKRFNMSQSIADFRIRSVMCAPLWTQQDNKAFGVIQLDTQDRSKKFTQEDLKLLMAVASHASIALENGRLIEDLLAQERLRRDVELAHQVQLSFLPRQLPEVPGYEFHRHYEPAQVVGGDYYDFIPLSGQQQRLAIMLGDVAGKGVPAALLMAKLSSDARFSVLSEPDLARAVTVLNDLLCQHISHMDRFVTLAAGLLDASAHTVTVVNAGHPAPLLIRHDATAPNVATSREVIGLPLGVEQGYPYQSYQLKLQPGDCLLMFSDGVTEAMDKQNNQIRQKAIYAAFQEGARTPKALGERILKIVEQHASGRPQHDDITLVCFGRTIGKE